MLLFDWLLENSPTLQYIGRELNVPLDVIFLRRFLNALQKQIVIALSLGFAKNVMLRHSILW